MTQSRLAPILNKLANGHHLSSQESFDHFHQLMLGQYSPIEIAAFLMALKSKGETVQEIVGLAQAMRKAQIPFPYAEQLKQEYTIVDCAGSGGDGMHTLNISTASAIVFVFFSLVLHFLFRFVDAIADLMGFFFRPIADFLRAFRDLIASLGRLFGNLVAGIFQCVFDICHDRSPFRSVLISGF